MQQHSNRKELVSASLDKPDVAVLKCQAFDNDRSLSELIRLICREYIEKNKLRQKYPQA